MPADKWIKKLEKKDKPVNEWTPEEWEAAYNILAQKNKQLISALGSALQTLSRAVGNTI